MNAVNTKPYRLPSDGAVWLVTGCSSGIGREIAKHIASQPGQRLIATARDPSSLSYLDEFDNPNPSSSSSPSILRLALDVTSPASVEAAFTAAAKHFGSPSPTGSSSPSDEDKDGGDNDFHIDVLVNNAGYALSGDTEAATEEEMHEEMETNFFGTVRVTMQALKWIRPREGQGRGQGQRQAEEGKDESEEHRGGLIFNMSSLAGVCAFPGHAFYHASKFAVEGWTESVAREMHPDWNISFTILEPSAVRTNFESPHSKKTTKPHPAYVSPSLPSRQLEHIVQQGLKSGRGVLHPAQIAKVIWHVATRNQKAPLHLPLGSTAIGLIKVGLSSRLKEVEEVEEGGFGGAAGLSE